MSTETSQDSNTESAQATATTAQQHTSIMDNWKERFEELLKSKNIDDVKAELTKLATDLQKEIQSFDINSHLSASNKDRVKSVEKSYTEVVRSLHKVQKQFDREFNKTLRLVTKTRTDAEKRLSAFKKQFGQKKAKLTKVVKQKVKRAKPKAKKAAKKRA